MYQSLDLKHIFKHRAFILKRSPNCRKIKCLLRDISYYWKCNYNCIMNFVLTVLYILAFLVYYNQYIFYWRFCCHYPLVDHLLLCKLAGRITWASVVLQSLETLCDLAVKLLLSHNCRHWEDLECWMLSSIKSRVDGFLFMTVVVLVVVPYNILIFATVDTPVVK